MTLVFSSLYKITSFFSFKLQFIFINFLSSSSLIFVLSLIFSCLIWKLWKYRWIHFKMYLKKIKIFILNIVLIIYLNYMKKVITADINKKEFLVALDKVTWKFLCYLTLKFDFVNFFKFWPTIDDDLFITTFFSKIKLRINTFLVCIIIKLVNLARRCNYL